jgi:hypothetical protein
LFIVRPKAYPYDYQYFYEELAVKYPTLVPEHITSDQLKYAISLTASSSGPVSSLLRPVRDRSERFQLPAALSQEITGPLVFPFGSNDDDDDTLNGRQSDENLVSPKALSEAGAVYADYLYIPLSALQLAEAAEAMDRVERGFPATFPGSQRDMVERANHLIPETLQERQRRIREFYASASLDATIDW